MIRRQASDDRLGIGDAISEAAFGEDVGGIGRFFTQFAPKVLDKETEHPRYPPWSAPQMLPSSWSWDIARSTLRVSVVSSSYSVAVAKPPQLSSRFRPPKGTRDD